MKRKLLLVMVILAVPFLNSCVNLYATTGVMPLTWPGFIGSCTDMWGEESFVTGQLVFPGYYMVTFENANPFGVTLSCDVYYDNCCGGFMVVPGVPMSMMMGVGCGVSYCN